MGVDEPDGREDARKTLLPEPGGLLQTIETLAELPHQALLAGRSSKAGWRVDEDGLVDGSAEESGLDIVHFRGKVEKSSEGVQHVEGGGLADRGKGRSVVHTLLLERPVDDNPALVFDDCAEAVTLLLANPVCGQDMGARREQAGWPKDIGLVLSD